MTKYFNIDRLKEAICHLEGFDSGWVLIPLVFAVNGVNQDEGVSPNIAGRPGTDNFLERYFHGALIGLPDKRDGRNSMRPRFSDVQLHSPEDFIVHQSIKLWGNNYSSRGYREMGDIVVREGRGAGTSYRLLPSFGPTWEENLGEQFRFEELLVWLYAFSGLGEEIQNWHDLFEDFKAQYPLFNTEFEIRFHVNNNVPWPDDFLDDRPSNENFQRELYPSEYGQPANLASVREIVDDFSNAIRVSGIAFGTKHDETVRAFVASLLTKPLVILTGLSGSGKTQIAVKFGEWLGESFSMLVPVRPDWTGGEVLFGYENALDPAANPAWIVPPVLSFMLAAARDPANPYLLILDEMNLAHVERYFGDFLSGAESRKPVLPNLFLDDEGKWRLVPNTPRRISIPRNLFVVGTVNVDETTYMFSPKVLDRANSMEFRVSAEDLNAEVGRPVACQRAERSLTRSFLAMATDDNWQRNNPPDSLDNFTARLRELHAILGVSGFEFAHRTFLDAIRFTAFYCHDGQASWQEALDLQVLQKVLPRLHGSYKRLGPTLRAVAQFCFYLVTPVGGAQFDPEAMNAEDASLPRSFKKLLRMYRSLIAYQYTSFTES